MFLNFKLMIQSIKELFYFLIVNLNIIDKLFSKSKISRSRHILFIFIISGFLISSVDTEKYGTLSYEKICPKLGKVSKIDYPHLGIGPNLKDATHWRISSPTKNIVEIPVSWIHSIEKKQWEEKRSDFLKLYFKACGYYPTNLSFLPKKQYKKNINNKTNSMPKSKYSLKAANTVEFYGTVQKLSPNKYLLKGLFTENSKILSEDSIGFLVDSEKNISYFHPSTLISLSELKILSVQWIEKQKGIYIPLYILQKKLSK